MYAARGNERTGDRLSRCMLLTGSKRVEHFAAMVLIGDGVMALVHPTRDAHAWNKGPKAWRRLMEQLADRPMLTMAIGAAQVAGGIWWALSQNKRQTP